MSGRESGFFFLPVVLFICIGMGSVFALLPSFQHEEFLEAQRLRNEQARAAAEGAAALALHRRADVKDEKIGFATVSATFVPTSEEPLIHAEATVPGPGDIVVRFAFTR